MPDEFIRVPERIRAKIVRQPDGCWRWIGYTMKHGYGTVRLNNPRRKECIHRAVYMLLVGPIPSGLECHHTCRLRACCNPAHLQLVRHVDHVYLDGNAVKTACKHGHPLDETNTYAYTDRFGRPQRACRTCRFARNHPERAAAT